MCWSVGAHHACMRLYGFVYCTLTVSELVNKGIDTYLPNCNFSDSLRGGGGGKEFP